jgi:glycosyltransferase involved in cell wall biosynthesis
VVANSIELPRLPYRRRMTLAPRILSNRNLEPMYNVGLILQAFARIQRRYPTAQLTVAGDGSQRGALERLAHDLALMNVTFVGRIDPRAMPQLYDAADLYLNASNIDNAPLSILEAFACGVPVVSTRAGGIPFIVQDGTTGRLVPCNDADALATAALELLDLPEQALRLADQARAECVTQYAWDRVVDRWCRTYADLDRAASNRADRVIDVRSSFPGE